MSVQTLELTAKLGSTTINISLPEDATIGDLHAALAMAFSLSENTSLRILVKGKALKSDDLSMPLASAGVAPGAKLMVMASRSAEIKAIADAKPERMRGFAEDDARIRTGSSGASGGASSRPTASRSAASPHRFHGLQPLRLLPPGATPAVSATQRRLEELSSDPGILHILKTHGWAVGRLCEMPPEGLVGVSDSCVMGFNKNAGQEIHLRLRTDDWQGMRTYTSVVPVLLHELTHNVHSDHGEDFKALNSQLGREYRAFMAAREAGRSTGGVEMAPARSAAPSASEEEDAGRVLGGGGGGGCGGGAEALSAREAAARAAAARFGFAPPTQPAAEPALEIDDWVCPPATGPGELKFVGLDERCACGVCDGCSGVNEEVVVAAE